MDEVRIPVILREGEHWLVLNSLSNAGKLRATAISKSHPVLNFYGHHCEEVHVKTSIRYAPKKWIII